MCVAVAFVVNAHLGGQETGSIENEFGAARGAHPRFLLARAIHGGGGIGVAGASNPRPLAGVGGSGEGSSQGLVPPAKAPRGT